MALGVWREFESGPHLTHHFHFPLPVRCKLQHNCYVEWHVGIRTFALTNVWPNFMVVMWVVGENIIPLKNANNVWAIIAISMIWFNATLWMCKKVPITFMINGSEVISTRSCEILLNPIKFIGMLLQMHSFSSFYMIVFHDIS